MLVSHVFSRLPFGSLAYRINLMSAVLAAVMVGLLFLIFRRLGCRPMISGSIALASGLGRLFWSTAVIAEVYTLNASLVAGMVLALLVWHETRRASVYYAAVGLFALSLGNHTTVALLAPAMAGYVLSVDARWALRGRWGCPVRC